MDDFLDTVFMAEERIQSEAYEEGYQTGAKSGSTEGFETGLQKGAQLGFELGSYKGCALLWNSLLKNSTDERIQKTLDTLLGLLEKFDIHDIDSDTFWEEVKAIRAKFKQVSSLLNITIKPANSAAASVCHFDKCTDVPKTKKR